jgi:hypothetical protein
MKLSYAVPTLRSPGVLWSMKVGVPRMKSRNAWLLLLIALSGRVWADEPIANGYKLQPGDLLLVAVWKETELQGEVLIRPDGGMSFALAGELPAAGHTVAELTAMLETRVRKFVPDAVVTVSVKAVTGNRVYVIGKVAHPGDFPLSRPLDVMQAMVLNCRQSGSATATSNVAASWIKTSYCRVVIRLLFHDLAPVGAPVPRGGDNAIG